MHLRAKERFKTGVINSKKNEGKEINMIYNMLYKIMNQLKVSLELSVQLNLFPIRLVAIGVYQCEQPNLYK